MTNDADARLCGRARGVDTSPVLASRRLIGRSLLVLGAWTAFGLLTSAQAQLLANLRGESRPLASLVFGPAMIGAWLWALYTPVLVAVARRIRRLREGLGGAPGWTLYLLAHLATMALVVVVDVPIWAAVRPLIDGVRVPLDRVLAGTLLMNVFGYVAVVAVTEAVDFAARWRERDQAAANFARDADALRKKLDEARLHALESQLQPHFLYNTLNVVAELVHSDPDVADAMLTQLGSLLRRSCMGSSQVVSLGEEIGFVRAYGEILARRYRDRARLTIVVPSALLDRAVPSFLLQPLVENAFRHGVERREGATSVEVIAQAQDGALRIHVRDRELGRPRDGVRDVARDDRMTPEPIDDPSDRARAGIGLRNTRERLALLYGRAADVTLARSAHETVASVRLPLRPADVRAPEAEPVAV